MSTHIVDVSHCHWNNLICDVFRYEDYPPGSASVLTRHQHDIQAAGVYKHYSSTTPPYLPLVTESLRSNPNRTKCPSQAGMPYKMCRIPTCWHTFLIQLGNSLRNISPRHIKLSISMALLMLCLMYTCKYHFPTHEASIESVESPKYLGILILYICICTLFTISLNVLHLHCWYHRLIPIM